MPVTKTKNTGYPCLWQRQKTLGIYSCDKDKKHRVSIPVTNTKNTGYPCLWQRQKTQGIHACDKDKKHGVSMPVTDKKHRVSMPVTKTKNIGYPCLWQRQKTQGIHACDKDKKHWESVAKTRKNRQLHTAEEADITQYREGYIIFLSIKRGPYHLPLNQWRIWRSWPKTTKERTHYLHFNETLIFNNQERITPALMLLKTLSLDKPERMTPPSCYWRHCP